MQEGKQTDKNVLIYCRESRDDGYVNYDRIETQRDILIAYCESRRLGKIVGIIMDDNKSGTDFERLRPVKERILNNEADILLTKDASRLGRNVLESLKFTEFLGEHGVELVFESEAYDEDMFPLIAWFNERRAKEDSLKIRRVLKHKMEEGAMVIKAPYGYIKQGNKLIVDKETAAVVKEIYDLYLSGLNKANIAEIMNQKGYPTPSMLKPEYGEAAAHTWNAQHIGRILSHTAYTGDMPYGMRRKLSYKSKRYISAARRDWIIKANHHEAIITKDTFVAARKKAEGSVRHTTVRGANMFSGLLVCGECGSAMYRKTQSGKSPWYVCAKYLREGASGCNSHRIMEGVLELAARSYIKQLVEMFGKSCMSALDRPGEINSAANEQIERLKQKASKIYDDKLNGILPDYLFEEKIKEITREYDRLSALAKENASGAGGVRGIKEIIETLPEQCMNSRSLRFLFSRIIVLRPGEAAAALQNLHISDEEYKCISAQGGVVFVQRFALSVRL